MSEQGVLTNMAALWYKRRYRYVDNKRVKLKIVLPTTAMAKFAIADIASLESIFTLEINREIFIPNREGGYLRWTSLLSRRVSTTALQLLALNETRLKAA